MSGSSLDGLDIAYCRFETSGNKNNFIVEKWELLQAETYPFSDFWKTRLRQLPGGSAFELMDAHAAFGAYLGELINRFVLDKNIDRQEVDLIASHGHTVFHEPAHGFTTQIGDGAAMAVTAGCTVINDFRSADIALGGQGAPIAPIADKMLLPGYDFYLNLGGIANITCNINGRFIAFDICGANQILNALANELNLPFDDNGNISATGELIPGLLEKQLILPFFKNNYPKSLSNQWVRDNQTVIFLENNNPIKNKLFTATELTAHLISESINIIIEKENFNKKNYNLLVTGGGAYNSFLINRIQYYLSERKIELIIPDKKIIDFKEASLMAMMGVMRMENLPNCLASVTGAERDVIGGAVFVP